MVLVLEVGRNTLVGGAQMFGMPVVELAKVPLAEIRKAVAEAFAPKVEPAA